MFPSHPEPPRHRRKRNGLARNDLIRRSAPMCCRRERQSEVAKLIDVSKCIGCKACQSACIEWNDIHDDDRQQRRRL